MAFPNQGSKKKTSFTGKTEIDENAYFDYFSESGNFRIKKSDYLTAIGATGTIEQVGEDGATQILNKSGTVNQIRSFNPGAGIKSSVSPRGSLHVDTDLLPASGGQQILINEGTAPQIRALEAGGGVSLTLGGSGDTIKITATGGELPASNNTVVVNTLADLPGESGGERLLAANTEYFFNNDLEIDVPLRLQEFTVVSGTDNLITNITYIGTGSMLVAEDVTIKIKDIGLTCPNAEVINYKGTVGQPDSVEITRVFVFSAASGGSFTDAFFVLADASIFLFMSGGFSFDGFVSTINFERVQANVAAGSLFNLGTSVTNFFYLSNAFVDLDVAGHLIDGGIDSVNIEAGGIGTVTSVRTTGTSAPLNGVSVEDRRWEFAGCNQILDTRPDALMYLSASTVVTIPAQNVPTPIQGIWVVERQSQFDALTTGVVEYNRLKPFITPFTAVITIQNNGGNNQEFTVYWAINGAVQSGSAQRIECDPSEPEIVTCIWQAQLNDGDFLQVYVENNSSNNNLTVQRGVFRVN